MIERAITPRSHRWGRRALGVAITAVAASLATDSGAIRPKMGEALVHAWRNLGEAIVRRDLAELAGMLDRDRADLGRAEDLRDALAVRLQALQVRRCADGIGLVPARYAEERARTDRGVADLDGAIAALSTTIARADRYIDSARRLIRARETDLCALQALADSRRASHELAGLDGVLPRWEGRAGFAAEQFGSSHPAAR